MLTTQESRIIDELVAHGWEPVELPEVTEDEFLAQLVAEGVADDLEAARAALEDMGEDPSDWIDAD